MCRNFGNLLRSCVIICRHKSENQHKWNSIKIICSLFAMRWRWSLFNGCLEQRRISITIQICQIILITTLTTMSRKTKTSRQHQIIFRTMLIVPESQTDQLKMKVQSTRISEAQIPTLMINLYRLPLLWRKNHLHSCIEIIIASRF